MHCLKMKMKVKSLSYVQLFATPRALAYQVPPSMGFSRLEYWSVLPFPSPGDLPDPGTEPWSPALFSSVQLLSRVLRFQPHESQHARPPCLSLTPGVHPNSHPSSQWCHPAISSSVVPVSSRPNASQHQCLFKWVNSSHEVAKVLEFQLQHHSFQRTPRTDLLQNGPVGSPCSPRDSQESSPTPQFKSINSSSFLHSPTLASIHDHWKNHSLD